MTERKLIVLNDGEGVARHVAGWIVDSAIAKKGRFALSPSGGSTPKRLYQILAEPAYSSRMPWQNVHLFWGDERFVPHDHRDSNFRMARDAFLMRVPVPDSNIHAVPTEGLSPEQAAAAYETTLKCFYGAQTIVPGQPLFDLTLLGIGEDGHTASLFPGQPALLETQRWAVAVIRKNCDPRITLTYPALNSSRDVAFLATGVRKSDVVARAHAGDEALPAAIVRPVGRLHWFTDRAAAEGAN